MESNWRMSDTHNNIKKFVPTTEYGDGVAIIVWVCCPRRKSSERSVTICRIRYVTAWIILQLAIPTYLILISMDKLERRIRFTFQFIESITVNQ